MKGKNSPAELPEIAALKAARDVLGGLEAKRAGPWWKLEGL